MIKIEVDECYQLDDDYHNVLISSEVKPEPTYVKLKLSERTFNKIHYKDVYILEPHKYYKVTIGPSFSKLTREEKLYFVSKIYSINFDSIFLRNGLLCQLEADKDCIYIYNAGGNNVFLRKGTILGEVSIWMSI